MVAQNEDERGDEGSLDHFRFMLELKIDEGSRCPAVENDRGDEDGPLNGPERLLCLINAPARGDYRPLTDAAIAEAGAATFALLERNGLRIHRKPETTVLTTPSGFDALFPSTGGALYGQAVHGWSATFARPGTETKLPGLYLASGSAHPGAGVPMAALSGRLAALAVLG